MHYSKYFVFVLLVILTSCTRQKPRGAVDNNSVEIQVEEIKLPPQSVLQLKSYYLSSAVSSDSTDVLIGYNNKLHSLDYINLKTKLITQAILPSEGPQALTRLCGMYAHTLDSIWVCDDSERVFLIDSTGTIKRTIPIKPYLTETEEAFINTNYAMSTSHLYYNAARQSIMFLVKDIPSDTFAVKEVFINEENKVKSYKLSPSEIIPDLSEGYAYINTPNVNFIGENIIYNYPVESSIYTLNILTNKKNTILAESDYSLNVVEKCTSGKEYSDWEKHRLENPHFYDVMYIPQFKMYARLHVDRIDFDIQKGFEKLLNDRDLYLMLFNENFEKIHESKLAKHRYNCFTGWNVTNRGVVLFVDNILDERNNTDDLEIDLISPK